MSSSHSYIKRTPVGPLLWLLVSLISGSAIFLWAKRHHQETERWREDQSRQLEEAETRYLEGKEALNIVEQYYPNFQKWRKQGFLGADQRFIWADYLNALEKSIDIPAMHYSIAAQEPYEPPGLEFDPTFRVYQTRMTLNLGLLHEGDLFTVLEKLNTPKMPGIHTVQSCSLEQQQNQKFDPKEINIRATCILWWYTANIEQESTQ